MKPWYIQMCLKHESVAKHNDFKKLMGLDYYEESLFMRLKEAELIAKNVGTIKTLQEIKQTPDTVFHTNFLVKKFLQFTDLDMGANANEWATDAKAKQAAGAEAAGGAAGGGTAPVGGQGEAGPIPPAQGQGQAQVPAQEAPPPET